MNKKKVITTLFLLLFCILCILVLQLVIGGCFWWECMPNRSFHVLDWELPAYLFPKDANLSSIQIPSEAGGEIEIGSQDIHWNKGNGIAGYDINRYATINKAVQEYGSEVKQMVDDGTRRLWIHPNEVTFVSITADEMIITCGNWSGRRCGMVARYQEYVISFDATMDEEMGYAEFEKIVIYLDKQISNRLYP
jgi:hypothetical protein